MAASGSTQGNQARTKRYCGLERGLNVAASWTICLPVDSRYLPPHMLRVRNVETPYASCGHYGSRRGPQLPGAPSPPGAVGIAASVLGWERHEAGRSACGLEMSEEANAVL